MNGLLAALVVPAALVAFGRVRGSRTTDRAFMVNVLHDYLYGDQANQLSKEQARAVLEECDGFARQIDQRFWDWSHVRDSSPEGLRRATKKLLSFVGQEAYTARLRFYSESPQSQVFGTLRRFGKGRAHPQGDLEIVTYPDGTKAVLWPAEGLFFVPPDGTARKAGFAADHLGKTGSGLVRFRANRRWSKERLARIERLLDRGLVADDWSMSEFEDIDEILGRMGSNVRGSRTTMKNWSLSQDRATHETRGYTTTAEDALDAEAFAMFDDGVHRAFDVDEDERALGRAVRETLREAGIHPRWKALHWGYLDVARQERGKGFGRALVARVERAARTHGVRVIILGAGDIMTGGGHSRRFWEHMGYRLFALEYGRYDDRIMYKVLS
jgi:GNAT superfamily N-acetyltransferase